MNAPTRIRVGEISHFDAAFARLLFRLEELGLADNTIVVLTSDHGEMAGCHGHFGKGVMYEEAVHIPLIVRHPAGPKGKRTQALFSSVDFVPTLLDLCGLPPTQTAEGTSYGPLIWGEEQTARETVFMQYHDLCIRRGRFKLVADASARIPAALYDLGADPFEQDNLIHKSGFHQVIRDLQHELIAWYKDTQLRTGDTQEASRQSSAFASDDA